MNDISKISKMVKVHRKKSGLTQKALAQLAGVGKTAIFDIEHGKTTFQINTLYNILNILNITVKFESPIINDKVKEHA